MNGIDNLRAVQLNTPVTVTVVTVVGDISVEKAICFAPLREVVEKVTSL